MNEFGRRIHQLRKQKNMTLRHLADLSNLSYSFIASLEKGRYKPSRESIYSLAAPLDADPNELLRLAGFLPDQFETVENSFSEKNSKKSNKFEMENILNTSVTFQGIELQQTDKVALLSFLKTMASFKNSDL
ncbi:helix-turn-helix domain-containing protein [Sporosarcina siberiensis]|uniref:Helix-turn-helix domain-containing protein n=1 Tax=Sporosarcina siberiensis TaxID=1365606 RepID=A0ABW4SEJ7_9BACL